MNEDDNADDMHGKGFLARKHHKLRFTELDEIFFARLILTKCPDPESATAITVRLTLCDLFRRFTADELTAALQDVVITEAPKVFEIAADFISALVGASAEASSKTEPALDYYHDFIRIRLGWLKSGDLPNDQAPCVDNLTTQQEGRLEVFDVEVRPALLRERLGEQIPSRLEQTGKLIQQVVSAQSRPGDPGPRIDYRKQIEFLTNYLDARQQTTGETAFSFLSPQIPFRWILQHLSGSELTMPGIGTLTTADKILLPLFLEVNGFLDIIDLDLESDPRAPHDVVVRYSIHMPATRNIFGASHAGLDAATRARLTETELTLYHRLHEKVREGLVFGGKPRLEASFGTIAAWLIRKVALCLEEPTFLGKPAREWLERHKDDNPLLMEDGFFLPFLYERLRDEFGSRVVKKPERFGGAVDILFDDVIPVELKVRRGRKSPIDVADVDDTFRPGGQAAVYAGVSRLGVVAVLDLPDPDAPMVALENCSVVVERRFPEDAAYPTCIVVIVFRCYARSPSKSP